MRATGRCCEGKAPESHVEACDNVLGYEYNEDFSERAIEEGMPILPSVGVKVAF